MSDQNSLNNQVNIPTKNMLLNSYQTLIGQV